MNRMRHYVLGVDQADGTGIREFSHEDSMKIASGESMLPEFADSRRRYLQVIVEPTEDDSKLEVRMASAWLNFDHQGVLIAATAQSDEDEEIATAFERQTCAELALLAEEQLDAVLH